MEPPGERPGGPFLNFLRKYIWVISAVLGIVTITAMRPLLRHVPDPPPVMFELPEYERVDQTGQPFTEETLEGQVWVASFIFTSCPSTCPKVTRSMMELQKLYEMHEVPVKLVSFTVDPETDTPEVLKRYADTIGADPERWSFVTGELDAISELAGEGFRLGVGDKQPLEGGRYDIAHSTKLVLVDDRGGVRGYYGVDEQGIDEVFHRSQHVLREMAQR